MADPLERALELTGSYDEELKRLLPPGADIFDVHLHLGTDIDGMVGDYDALEEIQAAYGISRAFMFCLDEPDRHPAFRAANDRTLAYGERSAYASVRSLAAEKAGWRSGSSRQNMNAREIP